MGIPRFLRTLVSRYPLIMKNLKDKSEIPETDFFYIDLRFIIHEITHGDRENILFLIKKKSFTQIYEELCMALEELIDIVHPIKFVMIADDGVCPLAKLTEVNKRIIFGSEPKGINSFLISIGIEPNEIHIFDKDLISSGTNFMWELEEYVLNFIKNKQKTDIYWQTLDIVYSGANVEGEGEHKIVSHIRQYQKSDKYKEQTKYCIYSNDGDMILLSLLVHEPNIIILQEDNISSNEDKVYKHEFDKDKMFVENNQLIMISVLREYLNIEFYKYFTEQEELNFEYNIDKIFDDFVLLCLLFGNDFIPGIINLDNEGRIFEYLLTAYKESLPKCDDYFVKNTIINYDNLKEFFIELSKFEKNILNIKNNNLKIHYDILRRKKTFSTFKYFCDTMNSINKDVDELPNKKSILEIALNTNQDFVKSLTNAYEFDNKDKVIEKDVSYDNLFFVKFMKEYNSGDDNAKSAKEMFYKKKLGNKNLSEFYFSYLAGIQWTYYYYSNGIPNYNWMYKYHYVPFISDLAEYDISDDFNELVKKKIMDLNSRPLSPYALSSLTFKEKSFNELMPKQFSKVKKPINNYIRDIYKSQIDLNGEIFIRNGIVLVPFLSQKQLKDLNRAISSVVKDLKEEEKKTFEVRKSMLFPKNESLFEDNDPFIIDIIYSLKRYYQTINFSSEEMIQNLNLNLQSFNKELFNSLNKKFLPKIEKSQNSLILEKIKKIFEKFVNFNVNMKEFEIDTKFKESFFEDNNNKNYYLKTNISKSINYPSINCSDYNYDEETTIQEFGRKYKFTKTTKCLKINVLSKYLNIIKDNKQDIIKNILKEKIIMYDYPLGKIGVIEGIIYENNFYKLNEDVIEQEVNKSLNLVSYQKTYLSYEKSNITIKIKNNLDYVKDELNGNIKRIEIVENDDIFDSISSKYIPIELTSLNYKKDDDNIKSILNELAKIKSFYEKFSHEEDVNEIEIKFMCSTTDPLIMKAKSSEIFEDIEKRFLIEKKELENKNLTFLSNGQKIEKSKTLKDNKLLKYSTILIIASEPEKNEEK